MNKLLFLMLITLTNNISFSQELTIEGLDGRLRYLEKKVPGRVEDIRLDKMLFNYELSMKTLDNRIKYLEKRVKKDQIDRYIDNKDGLSIKALDNRIKYLEKKAGVDNYLHRYTESSIRIRGKL